MSNLLHVIGLMLGFSAILALLAAGIVTWRQARQRRAQLALAQLARQDGELVAPQSSGGKGEER